VARVISSGHNHMEAIMRIKVTYVDSHFDDGLTNITWNMDSVDAAITRWYALHYKCNCTYVNAHRS
jgi:hypothetical protein